MAPAAKVDIDNLCVNTIRCLAMDGVQAANSGHPGTPMAMAPVAYTLWNRKMRFNQCRHAGNTDRRARHAIAPCASKAVDNQHADIHARRSPQCVA